MAEPFLGQIIMFAGSFAPRGYALCDGQLLAISQNDALFSLLGTLYGGDGRTTFALPDLRGRAPVHMGNGPGLTNRPIGGKGGEEQVALAETQLPSHTHTVDGSTESGSNAAPSGQVLANPGGATLYSTDAPDATLAASSIGVTGGGQAHYNMMPYQCLNFCISLLGIYPSRN